ncbi:hypothetical protein G9A89_014298 [Geosiphon pyriformis]|nr:hypothetical protein G9A89_014298 [Geosiphon pyriformis]
MAHNLLIPIHKESPPKIEWGLKRLYEIGITKRKYHALFHEYDSKFSLEDIVINSKTLLDFITKYLDSKMIDFQSENLLELENLGRDIGYYGKVKIGGQTFDVLLDTASADFWVPSTKCKSLDNSCENRRKFFPQKSKTFKRVKGSFSVRYGVGSVKGKLGVDTFEISGMKAYKQRFGLSTFEKNFSKVKYDGILGLAFDKLSRQKAATPYRTPFSTLVAQHQFREPIFSFSLTRAKDGAGNGELLFGDVPYKNLKSNIIEIPISSDNGLWEINIDGTFVDTQLIKFNNRTTIIDTGSTLMLLPPDDAFAIHDLIPGAVMDNAGNFFVPCNTTTIVSLVFNGVKFNINPKDLARDYIKSLDLCLSGIAGEKLGSGTQWILGDVFLKNVISIFNIKNKTVGFARSEDPLLI